MEGRLYTRPFARSSRAAELAAAVAAAPVPRSSAAAGSRGGAAGPASRHTTTVPKPVEPKVHSTVPPRAYLTPPTSASSSSSSAATSSPSQQVAQEYSVRVPKTPTKPISIMRFNGALGVDPGKWTSLKMAREDNARAHKTAAVHVVEDDMPKFGAGSEFGREAREEAKRKKYGGSKKKYNVEEQPWIMKSSDKGNRKYRGVKEGGVSENASYYIFTQAVDGGFEVFPINHWYNFTPIQRYKSLTAEEAEEQFGRRNKIYNYFSVMVRKRLKAEGDAEEEEGEKLSGGKLSKKKSSLGLKVSEMEDWEESDNEDSDEGSDKEGANKKPKKKKGGKPKKKKKDSDAEAEEDSDDGDGEGRELDYISDTSETESEEEKEKKNAEVGVDQETGLKNLLDSDSDEEETKTKEDVANEEEEEEPDGESSSKKSDDLRDSKKSKSKKKPKAAKVDPSPQENLSDDDEDDDKMVDELDNAIESAKLEASANNSGNSRDGTPDLEAGNGSKRKASSDLVGGIGNASKKAKIELSPALVQSAASEGITEEAVRRYLLRKPMTVTELLQKFKSKKTKVPSQDMVNVIAHLLKKINPVKKTQNQKMYLYLYNNKS